MRFIPTRVHGMLDYLVGVLLIAMPVIFGFEMGGAATWIPVLLGGGAIVYSIFTDYEMGMTGVISMPTHLMLDIGSGVLLASSPWLFGFSEFVWAPHLAFGLLEIVVPLFTKKDPSFRAAHAR